MSIITQNWEKQKKEEWDKGLAAVFENYGDGTWIEHLTTFLKIVSDVPGVILIPLSH